MLPHLWIKEIKKIDMEGGYLIDGFPSVGFTSAIASESLLHTSNYELLGFIDSIDFPTVSVLRDGIPNYATRIYANPDLKVGIFTSYLTVNEPYHRTIAKMMLRWSKNHKCSLVLSSSPMRLPLEKTEDTIAAGSTESARKKIKDAGMTLLQNGTIPGIPGALLNEGMLSGQDVIVLLINVDENGPDFKASTHLCMAMSKILPGVSCNLTMMQEQAEIAERQIKQTEKETRILKDNMYG